MKIELDMPLKFESLDLHVFLNKLFILNQHKLGFDSVQFQVSK